MLNTVFGCEPPEVLVGKLRAIVAEDFVWDAIPTDVHFFNFLMTAAALTSGRRCPALHGIKDGWNHGLWNENFLSLKDNVVQDGELVTEVSVVLDVRCYIALVAEPSFENDFP